MCRATILRTLGVNGDTETIEEAKKRFEAHLAGKLIPADLRSAVSYKLRKILKYFNDKKNYLVKNFY
jgi:hypothetical protein